MDSFIYILVALAVVVGLYFAFTRKKAPALDEPTIEAGQPKLDEGSRLDPPVTPKGDQQPAAVSTADADESTSEAAASGQPSAAPSTEAPPAVADAPPATPTISPKRDVSGLRRGLSRSRQSEGFFGKLRSLFSGKAEINPELVDEIEEVLLSSDVGVATTGKLLEQLRQDLSSGQPGSEAAVWEGLRTRAVELLTFDDVSPGLALNHQPTVILMVGVNGAGKTTTIGKLATQLKSHGVSCVLAAGDTFRAAAVQQLIHWGKRVGCEVIHGKDGADPGSVVFDAIKKAQEQGAQVVLADTAGRLHTKSNLMAEMQKIARTAGKALEGAPHEVLLVIDSTNGQNALAQAKEFKESLPLSGIVLTKLDGTAKGGVVLGIADSLRLPVKFIGLGERPDDLHEFVVDDFVEALLGKET